MHDDRDKLMDLKQSDANISVSLSETADTVMLAPQIASVNQSATSLTSSLKQRGSIPYTAGDGQIKSFEDIVQHVKF